MLINIVVLDERAVVPAYACLGDAGADIVSIENFTLAPMERRAARTGFAIELPTGTAALVLPRSGNALKRGLTVVNTPGLIDTGYRGEVMVPLINVSEEPLDICMGDRIAQLMLVPYLPAEFNVVEKLRDSERGAGGFGHTGI